MEGGQVVQGRQNQCRYTTQQVPGQIDERMIKLLKDKWKVVSAGSIGIEGKYEINIFNELVIEYNKTI